MTQKLPDQPTRPGLRAGIADLAHAMDLEVLGVDPGDVRLELLIPDRPGGRWSGPGGVAIGWGDLQDLPDRLDPEGVAVGVDVAGHRFDVLGPPPRLRVVGGGDD
jgi:hypothetical protein